MRHILRKFCNFCFLFLLICPVAMVDGSELAEAVHEKGWIAFSARSEHGDWDLYLMRPDGSQRRNITNSPDANEAYPQFSRDGSRLLFRRLAKNENLDGNRHGAQGMPMISNSDGTNIRALGGDGDLPWASWSPDGKQVACLSLIGVTFVDLATGKTLRTLKRDGFFQQMTWSPDGKWLAGVSNAFGTGWSVARMNVETGETHAVSRVDNCTPDWFPDSKALIFSNRPPGQSQNSGYGWTQLWMAEADGSNLRLVYAENGRHLYGAHVSPDGKYVLFSGNPNEDGDPGNSGAPMALMRLDDAPIVGGEAGDLKKLHPTAKSGPVLDLPAGWEPTWTFSEAPAGNSDPAEDP